MHPKESSTLEMSGFDYQEKDLQQFRTTLLPYAYNIIGAMEPARDVVEEVLVPFILKGDSDIQNPTGYLVRSVINRSISHKNLLRNRQEHYPNYWLPEPVVTDDAIYSEVDKERILNYSLLVLMEKLTSQERAVFILKNAFEFSHPDIADTLEIEAEHSRQLYKRAKDKIHLKRGKRIQLSGPHEAILNELMEAMLAADLPRIKKLLKVKVESHSDGGPNTSAARKVLQGKDHVSKLLKAIGTKYYLEGTVQVFTQVNHQPAIAFIENEVIYRVMILEMIEGKISDIFVVLNPEKLTGFVLRR